LVMSSPLKLLIVDRDDERRERLAETVRQDVNLHAVVVNDALGVHTLVREFQPDMVIVACETAARDAIEDLRTIGVPPNGQGGRPVVMLVQRLSAQEAEDALRAGVAAYVVDNLDLEKIRAVIGIAIAQFHVMGELRRDLDRARTELADRKDIERAKGLVMKRRGLDEEVAYKLLRSSAMNQGKPIAMIARQLLSSEAILEGIDL
jgi:two-component system, response regulator / RNA-binding antiterminator